MEVWKSRDPAYFGKFLIIKSFVLSVIGYVKFDKEIDSIILDFIWDEVPTMVEIAIFWFHIHITNGLNFMYRKWYTGNQYMVKSAENRMRSNLELLPVINVKSRPRYISAQKISTLFWCTEWAWYWQIIFRFASIHGLPISIDGKSILTLYYSTLQKIHKSKYNFYFNHPKDLHDLNNMIIGVT